MTSYWTFKKARWYSEAVKISDYPKRVLEIIEPKVPAGATVLDIGAGCGALTIPLVKAGYRVTAIEPSEAMLQVLDEEVQAQGLTNIRCIPYRWEEAEVEEHDVVLCANIRSLLHENIRFLSSVSSYARDYAFLISGVGTENDKFFFKELFPLIFRREVGPKKDYLAIYQNLHNLGIYANVEIVSYNLDQPFRNLDEACEFWKEYLSLEVDDYDAMLKDFLSKRLVRHGNEWRARIHKRSAIIWWGKAGGERGERGAQG